MNGVKGMKQPRYYPLLHRSMRPLPKRDWQRAPDWVLELYVASPSQLLAYDPMQAEVNRTRAYDAAILEARRLGLIPPKRDRPLCGARCRDGHSCRRRACFNPYTWTMSRRCRNHGGLSSGPTTDEGYFRAMDALARGRQTKAQRSKSPFSK